MSEIYCDECYDSPKAEASVNPTAEVHCRVVGTWNKYEAYECLMGWIASNRKYENDCPLESVTLEPIEGTDAWDAYMRYSSRKHEAGESFDYQFSTSGGTSHVTRSFKTVTALSCVRQKPVVNFRNGIGYEDGRFEGVDIGTPSFTWSQSACWPLRFVDINYKKLLARFTCCVNDSPFAGFDRGEVKFEGITNGTIVTETDEDTGMCYYYYKLTYGFAAQPNMADLEIGDSGKFGKNGWDYMWVLREKIDDQTTGNTIMVPRQANVEQVYPYVNLHALGLDFSLWNGIVNAFRG